jgi:DNA-binding transcriptional MocR family regulator
VGILEQDLRLEVVVKPLGGYFLWIRLFAKEHQFLQAADFLEYCLYRGIRFLPGEQCDPSNSGSLSQFARLCFADLDETDLRDGAQLFVSLYRGFYAEKWAVEFSDGVQVGPGD